MQRRNVIRRKRAIGGTVAGSRRVKRRYSAGARMGMVPKFPFHFADQPLRKFCKLKYVSHEVLNSPGIGAITTLEYRANGMYDPEVAIGGDQPYGFDQLMAQYNHFTVLKSTFTIENLNVLYATNEILQPALYADAGTLASAFASGGYDGLAELPIAGQSLSMNCYAADTRGRQRSTTMTFDAGKYFGKKSSLELIGDYRFSGNAGADPIEQAYFGMSLYHPQNLQPNQSYPVKVTIVYYCVFSEPKWFVSS